MLRVLLVIHKTWWERKCPPFWPEQYSALAAREDIRIKVTGPGWPGWVQSNSLRDNMETLFPEADVCYLWRPFGIVEFNGIVGAEQKISALKVSAYQDDPKFSLREAKQARLDLFFYHDHWDAQFYKDCGIRNEYLPLAVNLDLYKEHGRGQSDRLVPVVLTGNQNHVTYPLRTRFRRILKQGRLRGRIREMPGYRMRSLSHVMREQNQYAHLLQGSRISLVSTCPHIPLTLRKYFESMAAGCVVVGDVPHSPPKDVRECINVVDRSMSDEKIIKVVNRLLKDPDECHRQSVRNRKVAERYGYQQFAERWIKIVKECL